MQLCGPNDVVQRGAVDVGHGEVLERAVVAGGVDRHDVSVVELGQHFLLAEESGMKRPRQVLFPVPYRLDGDPAIQRLLDCLVDRPHALSGDHTDDPEVTPFRGLLGARLFTGL